MTTEPRSHGEEAFLLVGRVQVSTLVPQRGGT